MEEVVQHSVALATTRAACKPAPAPALGAARQALTGPIVGVPTVCPMAPLLQSAFSDTHY